VNVAAQENDAASLLNHYRALTKLRKEHEALRNGTTALVDTGNPAVYAALRISGKDRILILVNLTGTTLSDYQLSLSENLLPNGSITPILLFGTGDVQQLDVQQGGFSAYQPMAELLPYGSYVFLLK
jgi:hypothetical protein